MYIYEKIQNGNNSEKEHPGKTKIWFQEQFMKVRPFTFISCY